MNDLAKGLALCFAAMVLSLALPGCGESASHSSGEAHEEGDGHDHAHEGDDHEGHDHAENNAEDGHDGHDHGEMRSLGSVSIAGTTLSVSVSAGIQPASEAHVDLEIVSGPVPAAVRFWIGDEAGTGALRAKADAHGDHFHGQTEAPASMTDARLWIEVETTDGERSAQPLPLEG